MSSKRFGAITALVYLILGLAAFSPILNAPFVSDDWDFLIIVARARSAFVCFEPLVGRFVRPLVVFIYYASYKAFGLWTLPYHLTVVLLHVLTAWLVCRLAQRVDARRRRVVGLASGLLFLLFAGHSEAVSWIAGAADPLQAPFVIGALLCFGRALVPYGSDTDDGPARAGRDARNRLALGWVLFAGALLAKETAAVFPAVALAFGLLEVHRATDKRRALRLTMVFAGGALGLVAVLIVVRAILFGAAFGAYSGLGTSQGRVLVQAAVFFLRTLAPPLSATAKVWLTGMRLAFVAGLAVVMSTIVIVRCRDRGALLFAIAATVLSLVPVLPLTISLISPESERFLYVPSMFSSIAIVLAVVDFMTAQAVAAALIGSLVIVHAVSLERSNLTWRESSLMADRILRTSIALIRQHNPDFRSTVVVLNLPDTLRGMYVLRNGFVSALRLLASDLDSERLRLFGVAWHSTERPDDRAIVTHMTPLEFRVDLHRNVIFPHPAITQPFFVVSDSTPHGFTIRLSPMIGRTVVLHVSEGRMNLTAVIEGQSLRDTSNR